MCGDRSQDWPFELPGSRGVTAREYLAGSALYREIMGVYARRIAGRRSVEPG